MKRLLLVSITFSLFSFQSAKAQSMTPVDLGLSVQWATCNVGADKAEDSGDLYAWGDLLTKTDFSFSTLRIKPSAKYNSDDNKTQLEWMDDVAYQTLGEKWRIPTKEEFEELIANCSFKRSERNGVKGSLLTSKKNGKSIFFPDVSADGYTAAYWSSSLSLGKWSDQDAWYFSHGNDYWPPKVDKDNRRRGFVVRPVYNPKAVSANSGSPASSQQASAQRNTPDNESSIGPVGVWKDKAAVIVFTLNRDGSAGVTIYQNGTRPSYRTTWREMDGRYIIGGIGAVSSWILYPSGDLYSLSESGDTEKVDIKIYKAL